MRRTLVTLTGPSCSGKSHLQQLLLQLGFGMATSFTTRPQRVGEINHRDYYFLSQEEYEALREKGGIAENIEFSGHQYGLTSAELENRFALDRPVVAVVEPLGARELRKWCLHHHAWHFAVYLTNPLDVLLHRWVERIQHDHKTTAEVYSRRLHNFFAHELNWDQALHYDLRFANFGPLNANEIANRIENAVRSQTRMAA